MSIESIFASSNNILNSFTSFVFASYTYMFGLMAAWYFGSKLINTVLNSFRGRSIV